MNIVVDVLLKILFVLNIVGLVYVLLQGYDGLVRLVLSLLGLSNYAETLHNSPHERQMDGDNVMPVSLILADCDADADPVATVQGLMELDFPEYEVIAVCNSVRTDALAKLVKAFGMVQVRQPIKRSVPMQPVRGVYRSPAFPGLVVLDKKAGGRHDALNAGVNVSRYPLFITLGAGGRLRKDALRQITAPFGKSHKLVGVNGLPRIGQGEGKGFFAGLQQAEYLRTFPAGMALPDRKRVAVLPSGFGAFRKKAVIGERGFLPGAGEAELFLRLQRDLTAKDQPCDIEIFAEPVLQTVPPKGLGSLFSQRRRWQKDMVSALWKNKGMTLNSKYHQMGVLDMPHYWFFEVIGPFLELFACIAIPLCYAFGLVNWAFFLAFLAGEVLLGMVISLAAVASQEIMESTPFTFGRLLKLVLCALLNNVLYRQIVLLFRVLGAILPRAKDY